MRVGDRVKVRKDAASSFVQPWRGRFEKGREGTIVQSPGRGVRGWLVEWDHGKVRWPHEWRMIHRSEELLVIESAEIKD